MKNTKKRFEALFTVCLFTLFAAATSLQAANSTDSNKDFLARYEQVRAALAADDLATAKKSATDLGEGGAMVAKSDTLEAARAAFAKLSEEAIKAAAGQSGYYVMHCPMKKANWVQTSDKVANPYGGKEMLTCGEIKK